MNTRLAYSLLGLWLLACGGTLGVSEAHVRLTGLPQFVCPSSTPRPTATQRPTVVQPEVYVPPSGWLPNTAVPGCRPIGHLCYAFTAVPGGHYSQPATWRPGATSTPRPTHTPYPTPTAYVRTQDYRVGNDVYVGGADGLALRLRVDAPRIHPLSDHQQVVIWEVALTNRGTLSYPTLPGAQVFVASVNGQAGYWYASQEAAHSAGLTLDSRVLDIFTLAPRQSVRLTLTALTPLGTVDALGWLLDPYSGGAGFGVVGGNTALWRNAPDPHGCTGTLDDNAIIPTAQQLAASATPSRTPQIPDYTGAPS